MYRFVQKHRWIPSLHLLGVALWILVGTALAGFAHEAKAQPQGISIVTDFAGDDLQRLIGGKELYEEIQVETEAEESDASNDPFNVWGIDQEPALRTSYSGIPLARVFAAKPSSRAQFSQPKRLYLEYEVFRI